MSERPRYYTLQGTIAVPCREIEWNEFRASDINRSRVGRDVVGELVVSTVFLGIDRSFYSDAGPDPILFETMILGGDIDDYQTRCGTWAEAEGQHALALLIAQAWVDLAATLVLPTMAPP